MHQKFSHLRFLSLAFVWGALLMAPLVGTAAPPRAAHTGPELAAATYTPIPYSEIAPKLQEIADNSSRVRFEVIGQSAGFGNPGYAFVYTPVWFNELGLGEDVEISARLVEVDFLVSGYWPGWGESDSAGNPEVIHSPTSGSGTATLIGLDITFRGYPENTFRLLGNAIFE